jgi:hypothetical protein
VRRDEAAAKAAEEAEEQRMQEVDAQRRMAILRGEAPPPIPDEPAAIEIHGSSSTRDTYPGSGGVRKKRKRAGEDDTEFEMRLASERLEPATTSLAVEARRPTSSAPLTDQAGHIDLFGDERARARTEKNEEAEKEKKKKQRELEDQYTMRFSNAAGKGGMDKAWYSSAGALTVAERPMKDVWGNEDPRRKERDAQRMVSSDPLAMMKKGASRVRELKEERRKIQEERDEELRQLRREQRHHHHRKERRHGRRSRDDGSPGDSGRRRHRSRDGHGTDGDHDREMRRRNREDRSAEHSGGRRRRSRDGRGEDRDDRERRRHREREDDRRSRHRSRSPPEHRRHRHRHEP